MSSASLARPACALPPARFGRGPVRLLSAPALPARASAACAVPRIGDDIRLFASTFVAGFLFVSILIA